MSETKTETCSHDWQWLIVQAPETLQWCRLCGALKALNSPVVLPADHERAALADALATALERWRFLFAEHDPDDVHPLALVNVIAQGDAALARWRAQEQVKR